MPDGGWPEFEFGYAQGQKTEPCAARFGADQFLCGRKVDRINVTIETPPVSLHWRCRELLDPAPPAVPTARCPVCGEAAPTEGGLVGPHGACVGVNLPVGRGQS